MKKYLLLFIFFAIGTINAQIINFPDANFKAKLLSASLSNTVALGANNSDSIIIDVNGNNEIEESEALLVYYLDVSNSNITSIEGLSYFTNLNQLYCNNNQLTNLDVSANVDLYYINCNNNLLTTIDTSTINDLLFGISCNDNNLTSLNLKGIGSLWNYSFQGLTYANNPNLNYICIREIDTTTPYSLYSYIQDINGTFGYTNCEVNTYCSFTPGGTFYTIQGNSKYDFNNNGCDAMDTVYQNLKFNITDGTTTGFQIANTTGSYTIPVQAGTHTITPVLENPSYFNVTPTIATVSFPSTASPYIQDFCVSPNGVHNDLEIQIIASYGGRSGYDSTYKIKYRNKGTQTQSGTISYSFDDAVLDYVSTNVAYSSLATNIISWNFTNLQPFESREISLTLNLNSAIETPPLVSGDVLNFSATINGLTDETPLDNISNFNQAVYNSFDPNDKICLEGNTISPSKIGDFVHYRIRFENTGTANAQNVVVKDVIDTSKFDVATLQLVDGSHNCIAKITEGNKVEFIFENINLPFDDLTNDGYVVFKIKTNASLVSGDEITNNASIYFDYNAPIVTNTAISTFQTLANNSYNFENYFTLSPIPAKEILNINSNTPTSIFSISVYNSIGQLVLVTHLKNNQIDVSTLKTGTYFIKMQTENGIYNSKFIKE